MVKLTMLTGEEMDLSITMGDLRRIKDKYPEYTNTYFEAMGGGKVETTEDAFWRSADVLYTAYLCNMAHAEKLDDVIGYQDFLDILPEDMNLVIYASTALMNPNRIGDFERYSKSTQKGKQKTR